MCRCGNSSLGMIAAAGTMNSTVASRQAVSEQERVRQAGLQAKTKLLATKTPWFREFTDGPLEFAPLTHISSRNRLAINLPVGCTRGCAFCVQEKDEWYRSAAGRETDLTALLKTPASGLGFTGALTLALQAFPEATVSLFDTGDICEMARDPDCLKTILGLAGIFEGVLKDRLTMVTARPDESPDTIALLELFGTLTKLTVFVSFGSLNDRLEPATFHQRLAFLEECRQHSIPAVPYFKPLAREWYPGAAAQPLLREVVATADCVAVGGLKLTVELVDRLARLAVPLPENDFSGRPWLDEAFLREFAAEVRAIRPIPVFKHRLCAIYHRHGLICRPDCPERALCGAPA